METGKPPDESPVKVSVPSIQQTDEILTEALEKTKEELPRKSIGSSTRASFSNFSKYLEETAQIVGSYIRRISFLSNDESQMQIEQVQNLLNPEDKPITVSLQDVWALRFRALYELFQKLPEFNACFIERTDDALSDEQKAILLATLTIVISIKLKLTGIINCTEPEIPDIPIEAVRNAVIQFDMSQGRSVKLSVPLFLEKIKENINNNNLNQKSSSMRQMVATFLRQKEMDFLEQEKMDSDLFTNCALNTIMSIYAMLEE